MIGIEGIFSRRVLASRGITAGSGFATTELRVLLHSMVLTLQCKWRSSISLKLYVDDLTLIAIGSIGYIIIDNFITLKHSYEELKLSCTLKPESSVASPSSLSD